MQPLTIFSQYFRIKQYSFKICSSTIMLGTNTNTILYGIKCFAGISEVAPLPVHHPQCIRQFPCAICEVTAMP